MARDRIMLFSIFLILQVALVFSAATPNTIPEIVAKLTGGDPLPQTGTKTGVATNFASWLKPTCDVTATTTSCEIVCKDFSDWSSSKTLKEIFDKLTDHQIDQAMIDSLYPTAWTPNTSTDDFIRLVYTDSTVTKFVEATFALTVDGCFSVSSPITVESSTPSSPLQGTLTASDSSVVSAKNCTTTVLGQTASREIAWLAGTPGSAGANYVVNDKLLPANYITYNVADVHNLKGATPTSPYLLDTETAKFSTFTLTMSGTSLSEVKFTTNAKPKSGKPVDFFPVVGNADYALTVDGEGVFGDIYGSFQVTANNKILGTLGKGSAGDSYSFVAAGGSSTSALARGVNGFVDDLLTAGFRTEDKMGKLLDPEWFNGAANYASPVFNDFQINFNTELLQTSITSIVISMLGAPQLTAWNTFAKLNVPTGVLLYNVSISRSLNYTTVLQQGVKFGATNSLQTLTKPESTYGKNNKFSLNYAAVPGQPSFQFQHFAVHPLNLTQKLTWLTAEITDTKDVAVNAMQLLAPGTSTSLGYINSVMLDVNLTHSLSLKTLRRNDLTLDTRRVKWNLQVDDEGLFDKDSTVTAFGLLKGFIPSLAHIPDGVDFAISSLFNVTLISNTWLDIPFKYDTSIGIIMDELSKEGWIGTGYVVPQAMNISDPIHLALSYVSATYVHDDKWRNVTSVYLLLLMEDGYPELAAYPSLELLKTWQTGFFRSDNYYIGVQAETKFRNLAQDKELVLNMTLLDVNTSEVGMLNFNLTGKVTIADVTPLLETLGMIPSGIPAFAWVVDDVRVAEVQVVFDEEFGPWQHVEVMMELDDAEASFTPITGASLDMKGVSFRYRQDPPADGDLTETWIIGKGEITGAAGSSFKVGLNVTYTSLTEWSLSIVDEPKDITYEGTMLDITTLLHEAGLVPGDFAHPPALEWWVNGAIAIESIRINSAGKVNITAVIDTPDELKERFGCPDKSYYIAHHNSADGWQGYARVYVTSGDASIPVRIFPNKDSDDQVDLHLAWEVPEPIDPLVILAMLKTPGDYSILDMPKFVLTTFDLTMDKIFNLTYDEHIYGPMDATYAALQRYFPVEDNAFEITLEDFDKQTFYVRVRSYFHIEATKFRGSLTVKQDATKYVEFDAKVEEEDHPEIFIPFVTLTQFLVFPRTALPSSPFKTVEDINHPTLLYLWEPTWVTTLFSRCRGKIPQPTLELSSEIIMYNPYLSAENNMYNPILARAVVVCDGNLKLGTSLPTPLINILDARVEFDSFTLVTVITDTSTDGTVTLANGGGVHEFHETLEALKLAPVPHAFHLAYKLGADVTSVSLVNIALSFPSVDLQEAEYVQYEVSIPKFLALEEAGFTVDESVPAIVVVESNLGLREDPPEAFFKYHVVTWIELSLTFFEVKCTEDGVNSLVSQESSPADESKVRLPNIINEMKLDFAALPSPIKADLGSTVPGSIWEFVATMSVDFTEVMSFFTMFAPAVAHKMTVSADGEYKMDHLTLTITATIERGDVETEGELIFPSSLLPSSIASVDRIETTMAHSEAGTTFSSVSKRDIDPVPAGIDTVMDAFKTILISPVFTSEPRTLMTGSRGLTFTGMELKYSGDFMNPANRESVAVSWNLLSWQVYNNLFTSDRVTNPIVTLTHDGTAWAYSYDAELALGELRFNTTAELQESLTITISPHEIADDEAATIAANTVNFITMQADFNMTADMFPALINTDNQLYKTAIFDTMTVTVDPELVYVTSYDFEMRPTESLLASADVSVSDCQVHSVLQFNPSDGMVVISHESTVEGQIYFRGIDKFAFEFAFDTDFAMTITKLEDVQFNMASPVEMVNAFASTAILPSTSIVQDSRFNESLKMSTVEEDLILSSETVLNFQADTFADFSSVDVIFVRDSVPALTELFENVAEVHIRFHEEVPEGNDASVTNRFSGVQWETTFYANEIETAEAVVDITVYIVGEPVETITLIPIETEDDPTQFIDVLSELQDYDAAVEALPEQIWLQFPEGHYVNSTFNVLNDLSQIVDLTLCVHRDPAEDDLDFSGFILKPPEPTEEDPSEETLMCLHTTEGTVNAYLFGWCDLTPMLENLPLRVYYGQEDWFKMHFKGNLSLGLQSGGPFPLLAELAAAQAYAAELEKPQMSLDMDMEMSLLEIESRWGNLDDLASTHEFFMVEVAIPPYEALTRMLNGATNFTIRFVYSAEETDEYAEGWTTFLGGVWPIDDAVIHWMLYFDKETPDRFVLTLDPRYGDPLPLLYESMIAKLGIDISMIPYAYFDLLSTVVQLDKLKLDMTLEMNAWMGFEVGMSFESFSLGPVLFTDPEISFHYDFSTKDIIVTAAAGLPLGSQTIRVQIQGDTGENELSVRSLNGIKVFSMFNDLLAQMASMGIIPEAKIDFPSFLTNTGALPLEDLTLSDVAIVWHLRTVELKAIDLTLKIPGFSFLRWIPLVRSCDDTSFNVRMETISFEEPIDEAAIAAGEAEAPAEGADAVDPDAEEPEPVSDPDSNSTDVSGPQNEYDKFKQEKGDYEKPTLGEPKMSWTVTVNECVNLKGVKLPLSLDLGGLFSTIKSLNMEKIKRAIKEAANATKRAAVYVYNKLKDRLKKVSVPTFQLSLGDILLNPKFQVILNVLLPNVPVPDLIASIPGIDKLRGLSLDISQIDYKPVKFRLQFEISDLKLPLGITLNEVAVDFGYDFSLKRFFGFIDADVQLFGLNIKTKLPIPLGAEGFTIDVIFGDIGDIDLDTKGFPSLLSKDLFVGSMSFRFMEGFKLKEIVLFGHSFFSISTGFSADLFVKISVDFPTVKALRQWHVLLGGYFRFRSIKAASIDSGHRHGLVQAQESVTTYKDLFAAVQYEAPLIRITLRAPDGFSLRDLIGAFSSDIDLESLSALDGLQLRAIDLRFVNKSFTSFVIAARVTSAWLTIPSVFKCDYADIIFGVASRKFDRAFKNSSKVWGLGVRTQGCGFIVPGFEPKIDAEMYVTKSGGFAAIFTPPGYEWTIYENEYGSLYLVSLVASIDWSKLENSNKTKVKVIRFFSLLRAGKEPGNTAMVRVNHYPNISTDLTVIITKGESGSFFGSLFGDWFAKLFPIDSLYLYYNKNYQLNSTLFTLSAVTSPTGGFLGDLFRAIGIEIAEFYLDIKYQRVEAESEVSVKLAHPKCIWFWKIVCVMNNSLAFRWENGNMTNFGYGAIVMIKLWGERKLVINSTVAASKPPANSVTVQDVDHERYDIENAPEAYHIAARNYARYQRERGEVGTLADKMDITFQGTLEIWGKPVGLLGIVFKKLSLKVKWCAGEWCYFYAEGTIEVKKTKATLTGGIIVQRATGQTQAAKTQTAKGTKSTTEWVVTLNSPRLSIRDVIAFLDLDIGVDLLAFKDLRFYFSGTGLIDRETKKEYLDGMELWCKTDNKWMLMDFSIYLKYVKSQQWFHMELTPLENPVHLILDKVLSLLPEFLVRLFRSLIFDILKLDITNLSFILDITPTTKKMVARFTLHLFGGTCRFDIPVLGGGSSSLGSVIAQNFQKCTVPFTFGFGFEIAKDWSFGADTAKVEAGFAFINKFQLGQNGVDIIVYNRIYVRVVIFGSEFYFLDVRLSFVTISGTQSAETKDALLGAEKTQETMDAGQRFSARLADEQYFMIIQIAIVDSKVSSPDGHSEFKCNRESTKSESAFRDCFKKFYEDYFAAKAKGQTPADSPVKTDNFAPMPDPGDDSSVKQKKARNTARGKARSLQDAFLAQFGGAAKIIFERLKAMQKMFEVPSAVPCYAITGPTKFGVECFGVVMIFIVPVTFKAGAGFEWGIGFGVKPKLLEGLKVEVELKPFAQVYGKVSASINIFIAEAGIEVVITLMKVTLIPGVDILFSKFPPKLCPHLRLEIEPFSIRIAAFIGWISIDCCFSLSWPREDFVIFEYKVDTITFWIINRDFLCKKEPDTEAPKLETPGIEVVADGVDSASWKIDQCNDAKSGLEGPTAGYFAFIKDLNSDTVGSTTHSPLTNEGRFGYGPINEYSSVMANVACKDNAGNSLSQVSNWFFYTKSPGFVLAVDDGADPFGGDKVFNPDRDVRDGCVCFVINMNAEFSDALKVFVDIIGVDYDTRQEFDVLMNFEITVGDNNKAAILLPACACPGDDQNGAPPVAYREGIQYLARIRFVNRVTMLSLNRKSGGQVYDSYAPLKGLPWAGLNAQKEVKYQKAVGYTSAKHPEIIDFKTGIHLPTGIYYNLLRVYAGNEVNEGGLIVPWFTDASLRHTIFSDAITAGPHIVCVMGADWANNKGDLNCTGTIIIDIDRPEILSETSGDITPDFVEMRGRAIDYTSTVEDTYYCVGAFPGDCSLWLAMYKGMVDHETALLEPVPGTPIAVSTVYYDAVNWYSQSAPPARLVDFTPPIPGSLLYVGGILDHSGEFVWGTTTTVLLQAVKFREPESIRMWYSFAVNVNETDPIQYVLDFQAKDVYARYQTELTELGSLANTLITARVVAFNYLDMQSEIVTTNFKLDFTNPPPAVLHHGDPTKFKELVLFGPLLETTVFYKAPRDPESGYITKVRIAITSVTDITDPRWDQIIWQDVIHDASTGEEIEGNYTVYGTRFIDGVVYYGHITLTNEANLTTWTRSAGFITDSSPPILEVTPAQPYQFLTDRYSFRFNCTDPHTGIANAFVWLPKHRPTPIQLTKAELERGWYRWTDLTLQHRDSVTARIQCYNKAGLRSEASTSPATLVDLTPPRVAKILRVNDLDPPITVGNTTISGVVIGASDPESGIKQFWAAVSKHNDVELEPDVTKFVKVGKNEYFKLFLDTELEYEELYYLFVKVENRVGLETIKSSAAMRVVRSVFADMRIKWSSDRILPTGQAIHPYGEDLSVDWSFRQLVKVETRGEIAIHECDSVVFCNNKIDGKGVQPGKRTESLSALPGVSFNPTKVYFAEVRYEAPLLSDYKFALSSPLVFESNLPRCTTSQLAVLQDLPITSKVAVSSAFGLLWSNSYVGRWPADFRQVVADEEGVTYVSSLDVMTYGRERKVCGSGGAILDLTGPTAATLDIYPETYNKGQFDMDVNGGLDPIGGSSTFNMIVGDQSGLDNIMPLEFFVPFDNHYTKYINLPTDKQLYGVTTVTSRSGRQISGGTDRGWMVFSPPKPDPTGTMASTTPRWLPTRNHAVTITWLPFTDSAGNAVTSYFVGYQDTWTDVGNELMFATRLPSSVPNGESFQFFVKGCDHLGGCTTIPAMEAGFDMATPSISTTVPNQDCDTGVLTLAWRVLSKHPSGLKFYFYIDGGDRSWAVGVGANQEVKEVMIRELQEGARSVVMCAMSEAGVRACRPAVRSNSCSYVEMTANRLSIGNVLDKAMVNGDTGCVRLSWIPFKLGQAGVVDGYNVFVSKTNIMSDLPYTVPDLTLPSSATYVDLTVTAPGTGASDSTLYLYVQGKCERCRPLASVFELSFDSQAPVFTDVDSQITPIIQPLNSSFTVDITKIKDDRDDVIVSCTWILGTAEGVRDISKTPRVSGEWVAFPEDMVKQAYLYTTVRCVDDVKFTVADSVMVDGVCSRPGNLKPFGGNLVIASPSAPTFLSLLEPTIVYTDDQDIILTTQTLLTVNYNIFQGLLPVSDGLIVKSGWVNKPGTDFCIDRGDTEYRNITAVEIAPIQPGIIDVRDPDVTALYAYEVIAQTREGLRDQGVSRGVSINFGRPTAGGVYVNRPFVHGGEQVDITFYYDRVNVLTLGNCMQGWTRQANTWFSKDFAIDGTVPWRASVVMVPAMEDGVKSFFRIEWPDNEGVFVEISVMGGEDTATIAMSFAINAQVGVPRSVYNGTAPIRPGDKNILQLRWELGSFWIFVNDVPGGSVVLTDGDKLVIHKRRALMSYGYAGISTTFAVSAECDNNVFAFVGAPGLREDMNFTLQIVGHLIDDAVVTQVPLLNTSIALAHEWYIRQSQSYDHSHARYDRKPDSLLTNSNYQLLSWAADEVTPSVAFTVAENPKHVRALVSQLAWDIVLPEEDTVSKVSHYGLVTGSGLYCLFGPMQQCQPLPAHEEVYLHYDRIELVSDKISSFYDKHLQLIPNAKRRSQAWTPVPIFEHSRCSRADLAENAPVSVLAIKAVTEKWAIAATETSAVLLEISKTDCSSVVNTTLLDPPEPLISARFMHGQSLIFECASGLYVHVICGEEEYKRSGDFLMSSSPLLRSTCDTCTGKGGWVSRRCVSCNNAQYLPTVQSLVRKWIVPKGNWDRIIIIVTATTEQTQHSVEARQEVLVDNTFPQVFVHDICQNPFQNRLKKDCSLTKEQTNLTVAINVTAQPLGGIRGIRVEFVNETTNTLIPCRLPDATEYFDFHIWELPTDVLQSFVCYAQEPMIGRYHAVVTLDTFLWGLHAPVRTDGVLVNPYPPSFSSPPRRYRTDGESNTTNTTFQVQNYYNGKYGPSISSTKNSAFASAWWTPAFEYTENGWVPVTYYKCCVSNSPEPGICNFTSIFVIKGTSFIKPIQEIMPGPFVDTYGEEIRYSMNVDQTYWIHVFPNGVNDVTGEDAISPGFLIAGSAAAGSDTKTVTAALVFGNSTIDVEVPPGVFPPGVAMEMQPLTDMPAAANAVNDLEGAEEALPFFFQLDLKAVETGEDVSVNFTKPLVLKIALPQFDPPEGQEIVITLLDKDGKWKYAHETCTPAIPSSWDRKEHMLTCSICHFTEFGTVRRKVPVTTIISGVAGAVCFFALLTVLAVVLVVSRKKKAHNYIPIREEDVATLY